MIIDCISDTHGFYPQLEGGDLLIVAGDLTSSDEDSQYLVFLDWLVKQKYSHKIVVAGNHDNKLVTDPLFGSAPVQMDSLIGKYATYLCDSGIEFQGLNIYGSPWTKTFPGMNPHCKAFTVDTEEELAQKWNLIPDDVHILVTHSPPNGILDSVKRKNGDYEYCGSSILRREVFALPYLKLHVFGHIHEHGGKVIDTTLTKFVNASHVNEVYEPVNKPVRIIL